MDRSDDWMEQSNILFHQAKYLRKGGFYPGACFHSQQAAEMAIKALLQSRHVDAWGHMLTKLLMKMPGDVTVPDEIHAAAAALDRMYTPTRYPNGFEEGVPRDYFRASDADDALAKAKAIIAFCRGAMDEKG